MTKPIETREAVILTELQQLKDLKTDTQKQVAKDNYLKLSQAYAHMHMDPQLLKSWAANAAINKNNFTHSGKIYYVYGLNFITGDRAKYEARLNSLKDGKELATRLLLDLTQYETKLTTIVSYYQDGTKGDIRQSHIDGIRAIKKIIDGKIGRADGLMSRMDGASRAQYNAFKSRYFGEILTGIDPKYMIVPKALESKRKTSTLGIAHEVVDPAKDAANFSASKADWMVKQWMNGGSVAALNSLKNLHARLDEMDDYTDAQVRNIQTYTQAIHRSMGNILTTQLSQAKNQGAIESAQKNIIQFAALITGKTSGDRFSTKVQSWLGTNGVDDRFVDEATASSVLKQALMKNSVESMGEEVAQEVHTELQSDAREAVSSLKTTKLTVDPITRQASNQSVYEFLISHRFFTDLPGALTKGYAKKGSDKVRGDLSAVIAMRDYITSESKQGVDVDQLIQEICANPRELWQGSIGGQAQGIVDMKVDDILGGGSIKKKLFMSEYWNGKNITGLTGQQKQIYDLYKDISGAGALDLSTSGVKMSQDMIKGALPTLVAIPLIASGFGAPAGVALIGGTIVGTIGYWAMDGRKFNSTKEMLIDRGSEMTLNVATAWGGAKIAKYGTNVAGKYLAGKSNTLIKIPLESSKIPSHVAQVMKAGDEVAQVALMTTKGIKPIGFAINSSAALADAGLGMGAEVFRQNILLENEQSFEDVFVSPQGAMIAVMSLYGAASGGDTKHAIIGANVRYLDGYVRAHPEARNMVIDLQDGHYTTLGRMYDQILKPAMEGKFTDSQGYVRLPDQVTSNFAAGVQEYGRSAKVINKTKSIINKASNRVVGKDIVSGKVVSFGNKQTNIDLVEAKKTIRSEVVDNAKLDWDAKLSKLESELKNQGLLTEALTADQKALLREIEDVGGYIYMLTAEQRAQKLALAQSDKAKALFGDNVDQVMRYVMDEGYLGTIDNFVSHLHSMIAHNTLMGTPLPIDRKTKKFDFASNGSAGFLDLIFDENDHRYTPTHNESAIRSAIQKIDQYYLGDTTLDNLKSGVEVDVPNSISVGMKVTAGTAPDSLTRTAERTDVKELYVFQKMLQKQKEALNNMFSLESDLKTNYGQVMKTFNEFKDFLTRDKASDAFTKNPSMLQIMNMYINDRIEPYLRTSYFADVFNSVRSFHKDFASGVNSKHVIDIGGNRINGTVVPIFRRTVDGSIKFEDRNGVKTPIVQDFYVISVIQKEVIVPKNDDFIKDGSIGVSTLERTITKSDGLSQSYVGTLSEGVNKQLKTVDNLKLIAKELGDDSYTLDQLSNINIPGLDGSYNGDLFSMSGKMKKYIDQLKSDADDFKKGEKEQFKIFGRYDNTPIKNDLFKYEFKQGGVEVGIERNLIDIVDIATSMGAANKLDMLKKGMRANDDNIPELNRPLQDDYGIGSDGRHYSAFNSLSGKSLAAALARKGEQMQKFGPDMIKLMQMNDRISNDIRFKRGTAEQHMETYIKDYYWEKEMLVRKIIKEAKRDSETNKTLANEIQSIETRFDKVYDGIAKRMTYENLWKNFYGSKKISSYLLDKFDSVSESDPNYSLYQEMIKDIKEMHGPRRSKNPRKGGVEGLIPFGPNIVGGKGGNVLKKWDIEMNDRLNSLGVDGKIGLDAERMKKYLGSFGTMFGGTLGKVLGAGSKLKYSLGQELKRDRVIAGAEFAGGLVNAGNLGPSTLVMSWLNYKFVRLGLTHYTDSPTAKVTAWILYKSLNVALDYALIGGAEYMKEVFNIDEDSKEASIGNQILSYMRDDFMNFKVGSGDWADTKVKNSFGDNVINQIETMRSSYNPIVNLIDELKDSNASKNELEGLISKAEQYQKIKDIAGNGSNMLLTDGIDDYINGNQKYGLNAKGRPMQDRLLLLNTLLAKVGPNSTIQQIEQGLRDAFQETKLLYGNDIGEGMFIKNPQHEIESNSIQDPEISVPPTEPSRVPTKPSSVEGAEQQDGKPQKMKIESNEEDRVDVEEEIIEE